MLQPYLPLVGHFFKDSALFLSLPSVQKQIHRNANQQIHDGAYQFMQPKDVEPMNLKQMPQDQVQQNTLH